MVTKNRWKKEMKIMAARNETRETGITDKQEEGNKGKYITKRNKSRGR
jgi:hypothetical protein